MVDVEAILSKEVFHQQGVNTKTGQNIAIQEVFHLMLSETLISVTNTIRTLRNDGKISDATSLKKTLPAVTFAASYYNNRKEGNEKTYNMICVLDIDKLPGTEIVDVIKQLRMDKFVIACWISPSGNGVKGLVAFSCHRDIPRSEISIFHRAAFKQLAIYFESQYSIQLDQTGKDVPRLCFLCHVKDLNIKTQYDEFIINPDVIDMENIEIRKIKRVVNSLGKTPIGNIEKKNWMNPHNRNKPIDRFRIQSIIKYLSKRNLSITFNYEDWYHIALAIADTFTFDIGWKYFKTLSKMDPLKYNEVIARRMIEYAYDNTNRMVTMGTIIYYAKNKDYYF